jgi:hypothetical protein
MLSIKVLCPLPRELQTACKLEACRSLSFRAYFGKQQDMPSLRLHSSSTHNGKQEPFTHHDHINLEFVTWSFCCARIAKPAWPIWSLISSSLPARTASGFISANVRSIREQSYQRCMHCCPWCAEGASRSTGLALQSISSQPSHKTRKSGVV